MPITKKEQIRFRLFIEKAKQLRSPAKNKENLPRSIPADPVEGLRSFIKASKPLLVKRIRDILTKHGDDIRRLGRWILPEGFDLMEIAGKSGFEDCSTNLIGWMLFPPRKPDWALHCQQSWLKTLKLPPEGIHISHAAVPKIQYDTDNGRTDLVLFYEDDQYLLIVESKIGSSEHDAPEGQPQTTAYPDSVRLKLGLPLDFPGAMVFLTPSGSPARDEAAINTTFEVLITSIVEALSAEVLPPIYQFCYSSIITNLLTAASSEGNDKAAILRNLNEHLEGQELLLTDEQIIEQIWILGPICGNLEQGAGA